MKSKVLIGVLFCAVFSMNAQLKKWTLEECVTYAIENNLTIEQFELDLENAEIDKSDAFGNLLPDLNGSTSISETSGLVVDPNSNTNVSGTIFAVAPSLTTNLTVFDGLRNINRVKRAKLNAISNQYRLDDLKDDIRLQVAQFYLDVLSNKEQLKVARAQYAVTEQDLKRTKELVESGVVPRGDLLEIEATAASQEQQIVNNEALVIISRISLAQLLQITDYDNFDVADESFDVPPSDILDNSAKVIFDKALGFRNDIKLAETNIELAEKDVKIARGVLYPTVTAFFNYNTFYSDQFSIDLDPDTGQPILDPDTGLPLFFRDRFIDQLWLNDGIRYGFQANIPVFNGWSARNGVRRAKIDLKRSELQMEQTKLELETAINQAYVDVKTFSKAYEAAEKNLEAREVAYQYQKDRFDVGLLNAFDFGQSQARLDDARANVIQSKYNYIFRLKILEFYFGIPIRLN
ncbi:MAG: TolC family protein [Bacteroidota bacterium]